MIFIIGVVTELRGEVGQIAEGKFTLVEGTLGPLAKKSVHRGFYTTRFKNLYCEFTKSCLSRNLMTHCSSGGLVV